MDMIFLFGLIEFFGDVWNDLILLICLLAGVLIGVFLRPWAKNKVFKLHPKDHRVDELEIEEESAISLECKNKKGMPPQRFYKTEPGYTGISGKFMPKPTTMFLAMEGTAYVTKPKGGKDIKLTLAQAAKTVLGENFYDQIPAAKKTLLEESKLGVTVSIEEILTPPGMKPITEEEIYAEQDRKAAENLWEGKKKAERGQWINLILGIGTGFAICAGLVLLGIFRAPAAEVVTQPGNSTTTALLMIWNVIRGLI